MLVFRLSHTSVTRSQCLYHPSSKAATSSTQSTLARYGRAVTRHQLASGSVNRYGYDLDSERISQGLQQVAEPRLHSARGLPRKPLQTKGNRIICVTGWHAYDPIADQNEWQLSEHQDRRPRRHRSRSGCVHRRRMLIGALLLLYIIPKSY